MSFEPDKVMCTCNSVTKEVEPRISGAQGPHWLCSECQARFDDTRCLKRKASKIKWNETPIKKNPNTINVVNNEWQTSSTNLSLVLVRWHHGQKNLFPCLGTGFSLSHQHGRKSLQTVLWSPNSPRHVNAHMCMCMYVHAHSNKET